VPQFLQALCARTGSPHLLQTDKFGTDSFQFARLLSLLALDTFPFGTAMTTPP